MFKFEFELNQKVKVMCMNTLTEGVIAKRMLYNTNSGTMYRYDVYIEAVGDCVSPWEQDLIILNNKEGK